MLNFNIGSLSVLFTEDSGNGLPEQIWLVDDDGIKTRIVDKNGYSLQLELEDGKILSPCLNNGDKLKHYLRNNTLYVECNHLNWKDEAGEIIPDFIASIKHEFHADGTAFADVFFTVENRTPPAVKNFEFKIKLELAAFENVKWGMFYRPPAADGTLIQTSAPSRFLNKGDDKKLENGIFPLASFNTVGHNSPQIYLEFFMEGGNSISGLPEDNESSIIWDKGNPVLTWNFQKKLCRHHNMPWQWRNQLGFIIKHAPTKRHYPPCIIYHHLDNYTRYPDESQIKAIAENGCQVLIMHENWRLDPQNGAVPYNEKRTLDLIEEAHKYDIRVALYMRGNENSVVEDHAEWFNDYLQYDFDGLYMDYGGPFHEISPPDESFQNGRIHFRKHYLKLQNLRETIGEHGVFYSHTGPMFSALGMNFVDGYVSGEGERGLLIKGRQEHEYYSMATVAPGTLWSAAFPEYSSEKIIPFLAATGQSPHNPIGEQVLSSSLSHPPVPGINDLKFRSLWKLWNCFKNEKNLKIYNDYNCRDIFSDNSDNIGHYLMVSGNKALCILSNFSDKEEVVDININWEKTGCKPEKSFLLNNSKVDVYNHEMISISPFGVVGIIFSPEENVLEEYKKSFPDIGQYGKDWLKKIEEQRFLRLNPPKYKELYMQITLSKCSNAAYEESLIDDLFAGDVFLGKISEKDKFKPILEIGKLTIGKSTKPIPIHEYLAPGFHRLGIRTIHSGKPFYSFVTVILSPEKDLSSSYQIKYYNELEKDRSIVSWCSCLI